MRVCARARARVCVCVRVCVCFTERDWNGRREREGKEWKKKGGARRDRGEKEREIWAVYVYTKLHHSNILSSISAQFRSNVFDLEELDILRRNFLY